MLAQCGAFPFDAKRRVVQYTPLAEADSDLRGGTDDDLIYINFNWLLDGERNSARDLPPAVSPYFPSARWITKLMPNSATAP